MRPSPRRFERLPTQYFTDLLARVAEAAATDGEPVLDLGRGNPEVGPPGHVVEALAASAARPDVHGYAPFSGLPELKEAIAARYADVYGVELDPRREVAVIPGTKSTLTEVAQVVAERGSTIVLPDPGYPDYTSGVALAAARRGSLPVDPEPEWDAAPQEEVSLLFLNFPSNPTAIAAPDGVFGDAIEYARRTGAAIVHDFAYGDLVFDGRRPASFLAEEGAREVGIELFSMSKSYGMAGWRLGFALGNAEIVRRVDLLQDHLRAGIFMPLQHAAIAALTGPQDSVEERRLAYERRRDRAVAALAALEPRGEGSFFVWFRLPGGRPAERVLAEARVALAPGEGFGERGAGCARLSLAVTDETLDAGLERLSAVLM